MHSANGRPLYVRNCSAMCLLPRGVCRHTCSWRSLTLLLGMWGSLHHCRFMSLKLEQVQTIRRWGEATQYVQEVRLFGSQGQRTRPTKVTLISLSLSVMRTRERCEPGSPLRGAHALLLRRRTPFVRRMKTEAPSTASLGQLSDKRSRGNVG